MARVDSFVRRNRRGIRDVSIVLALGAVLLYVCWCFDLFLQEGQVSPHEQLIEFDELLVVGCAMAVGLLLCVVRFARAQRREMARRIAAEREARTLAYKDPLTGLANRRSFDEALLAACNAPPGKDSTHALFLLDLNGFKQVNDVYGHGAGDQLLIVLAARLSRAVRDGDFVARLGGDEFAIVAQHVSGSEGATAIAMRIIKAFEEPVTVDQVNHTIGVGIGVALVPVEASTPSEATRKADIALYKAKAERRSALRFFESEMDAQLQGREMLTRSLRAAVASGAVEARYTPNIDLGSGAVRGFDIVPFWRGEEVGEIPAIRFIPLAEETGVIHELQDSILDQACRAASSWPTRTSLTLTIYAVQLRSDRLAERILSTLDRWQIAPSRLEVELAEATLVHNLPAAQKALAPLRERGVKFVIGKFGTGYSSLFHLRNFHVDRLKIDRSFVEAMQYDKHSHEITEALIGLGRGFGIETSVDGLTNDGQLMQLLGNGCGRAQGSHYGEVQTAADAFASLLQSEAAQSRAAQA